MRIYLAGDLCVEAGTTLVRDDRLPGLQGRIVFGMLAFEHHRAIERHELEIELWGETPPASADVAVRAIVSKVRGGLEDVGLSDAISHGLGAYRLRLPDDTWVDVEAAAEAIHRAEPALRDGNMRDAVGWGRAAATIGSRPFLPGANGPWAERRRAELAEIHLRALDCLAGAWIALNQPEQAARDAELVVSIDPFREPSHRLLITALANQGNRAGALRAYERCRATLVDELGVDPSPETQALYLELLD
jgi:DNA-binding SARP family transcriptional activator